MKSNRFCEFEDCCITASFGFKEGIATRCMAHILPGQENVKSNKCSHVDLTDGIKCKRQVYCGLPGGRPTHCIGHKQPGQINLRDRMCQKPDCTKYATYGPANKTRKDAIHCAEHSEKDEVLLHTRYRCQIRGCKRHPRYGLPYERPRHCELHKLPEEIFRRSHTCSEGRPGMVLSSYPIPAFDLPKSLPTFIVGPVLRPSMFGL